MSTTLLEEYLECVTSLPSEIKRNFELMRELDKEAGRLQAELRGAQQQYLGRARRKLKEMVWLSAKRGHAPPPPPPPGPLTRSCPHSLQDDPLQVRCGPHYLLRSVPHGKPRRCVDHNLVLVVWLCRCCCLCVPLTSSRPWLPAPGCGGGCAGARGHPVQALPGARKR